MTSPSGRARPAALLVVTLVGCRDSPDYPPTDHPPEPEAMEATLIEGGISANWARVIANSSSTEDFRSRTQVELDELDAFADQLVAIAVADSEGDVARKIRLTLSIVGDPRDAGDLRYTGAYDILRRIYEGGAGEISDLIDLDPRRGIELGLKRLEEGKMASPWANDESWPRSSGGAPGGERCDFLRSAVAYGDLRIEGGRLVFEFAEPPPTPHPDVDRPLTNVPDSLWFGRYDQMDEVGEVLRAAGFIKVPCDRGHLGRVTLGDGTIIRMMRNWSDAVSVQRRSW